MSQVKPLSTSQKTSNDCSKHYDIVISGGGVVGCLAALGLAANKAYKIALLEAGGSPDNGKPTQQHGEQKTKHAGFDARVIALAKRSIEVLTTLGVDFTSIETQNIDDIHVSDKGHIGQVHLSASQQKVDLLGKVVAIEALGEHLLAKVKNLSNVDYYCPATIVQADKHQDYIDLSIQHKGVHNADISHLHAKLLLVSDGGNSSTKQLIGFESNTVDYQQSAIVTNVLMQLPHNNTAYERFTEQGPIAFLPMYNNDGNAQNKQRTMSVVWCMQQQQLANILALSHHEFSEKLVNLFGSKLGRIIKATEPVSYPLMLTKVENFTSHRAICIGNAAQSLHPIAGQGFNLGIRDVLDLIQCLSKYSDVGCFASTQAYYQARKADKKATILATDTLVNVFSNQYLPMVVGRNMGLLGMNKVAIAKQTFSAFAMGERK